jgi:long-chain acyl-CoA synthetase
MIDLENCKNLADFIQICTKTYGQKIALKFRPRFRTVSFSYSDIYKLAKAYSQILRNNGVERGDRVIIWAYNSPYWVASFFGIQLRGAIAVPLNVQSSQNLIEKITNATGAKFIFKSKILPQISGLNLGFLDLEDIKLPEKLEEQALPKLDQNDLAEIVYTSGTTGFPKGVILTHKNILSNLSQALSIFQLDETDRALSILPLSHMFEQIAGMFAPFAAGAQVTYATALNPLSISKNLVEDKVTKMAAVPEFLKLTVRRLEEKVKEEGKGWFLNFLFAISSKIPSMKIRRILFQPILKRFGKLSTIISGGAALDPEIGRKWEKMGIYILQGYGTTEASPVISANSYKDRKITSVGKPLPGVEVRIAKDSEILVKGENIFGGYWQDSQKTKEAFQDSWYKTGDLGYFDGEGHLYICGRKKYLIVTEAGVNVYPEDIEFELNKLPGVEDGCVVGLRKNDRLLIHAVLLAPKIVNPEEVIAACNKKLEAHQKIEDFSIWPFDDFPRTVTKKVKREEVQKFLETQKIEEETLVRTQTLGIVEKCIAKITNLSESQIIGEKRLVEDLKMDSLERVELVAAIEEETGMILDEAEIGPGTTVSQVRQKVERKAQKVERYDFKVWPLKPAIIFLRAIFQKILVVPLTKYFVKIEKVGVENLCNLAEPILFYSNHLSAVDSSVILVSLPPKIREKLAIAAAADVLFEKDQDKKWEGILTFLFNIYPFARAGQIKSSLEYTGRLLDRGFSILAFPEGRISETGKMQPLMPGAGFLAVEMGVKILPIKISGTQKILPPGTKPPCWPKKGQVRIVFGSPLEFPPQTFYPEATEKIENTLMNL